MQMPAGLSDQIAFDSIWFSIQKVQKPFDMIRFDNNSIQFTIWFDRIPCCSAEKIIAIVKLVNLPGGIHPDVRNNWQNHQQSLSVKFSFTLSLFMIFWFQNLLQIELYRKSKNTFNLICIQFNLICAKTFDSITKYDSISIWSDSPGKWYEFRKKVWTQMQDWFAVCTTILDLGVKQYSTGNTTSYQRSADTQKLTMSLLSTVLTTISSGLYWWTSKRSFRALLPSAPPSWIRGEWKPSSQVRSSDLCGASAPESLASEL